MEKFDQPELHPRGFPLWVEILLVSALILTPLVMVSIWQYWQDHQEKHSELSNSAAPSAPAAVSETETKTPTETESKNTETKSDDGAAEVKTDTDAESKTGTPTESKQAEEN